MVNFFLKGFLVWQLSLVCLDYSVSQRVFAVTFNWEKTTIYEINPLQNSFLENAIKWRMVTRLDNTGWSTSVFRSLFLLRSILGQLYQHLGARLDAKIGLKTMTIKSNNGRYPGVLLGWEPLVYIACMTFAVSGYHVPRVGCWSFICEIHVWQVLRLFRRMNLLTFRPILALN